MPAAKRPVIRIHDSESNEIIDREMNDEEFAQFQLDEAKFQADKAAREERDATRTAILEKLGITADEAKLLLA